MSSSTTAGSTTASTQNCSVGQATAVQSNENLWEKAVEALSDEDKEHIDFNRADKLAILSDVLAAVEDKRQICMQKRWKYKRSNGEVIILRDLFEKMVVWVNKFKEVGDVAMQYDPGHASLPWAGVRFFLQAAVNDTQTFGAMSEGVELVSNLITRYAIFENLYLRTASAGKDQLMQSIVKLYAVVLEYLAKARRYYDRKTTKRMAMSIVQTTDAYTSKISEEQANVAFCARLVDAEYRQRMGDGVQQVQKDIESLSIENRQRLETVLSDLEKPINRLATQLSDLHDSLKKSERQKIFQWMSTIPHKRHHETMLKDRLPESGLWLFQKTEFIKWRKSSVSSILWLHGIPGSGKSRLVSSVIECLNSEYPTNSQPALISYFYCARNATEPQRADPDEILRSILKQLSCSKSDLPIREPVAEAYKKRKEEAEDNGCELTKLTLADSVELILAVLESNPATIIIDALDECDPARRHELLKALDEIIQKSASLVKVFVSSRDDNDIVCRLANSPNIFICASDNSEDIDRYVRSEVDQAIKDKRLLSGNVSEQLKSQIIATLIEGAQGMFRWVSLQIQNLCDFQRMKHEKDIILELGRLPKTLEDLYAVIYEQISRSAPTSRSVAEKTMKWLLCAQRPLQTPEFIAAVSVDPEGQYLELSNTDLLNMCCNMVVLDAELNVFRFAHLSVQEYLERRGDYTRAETHTLAAERCVDIHISELTLKPIPESTVQNNIFRKYATLYWPVHCRSVRSDQLVGRFKSKVKRFLFQGYGAAPSFTKWASAASELSRELKWDDPLRGMLRAVSGSPPTPLFLACSFGLLSIVNGLSAFKNVNWNQRNQDGNRGLHLAAQSGHEAMVRLLLERGADTNARNKHGWTALHSAAQNGHEAVVRLLLESGANANRKMKYGRRWTALHSAVENGHEAVVRLLLESGADANAKTIYGWTALLLAAKNGQGAMVQLFLESGANANTLYEDKEMALRLAAESGHEAVVRLLLESGANTNAKDKHGETALRLAVQNGHEAVVQLLLKSGTNVNAKCEDGETALHSAAQEGHEMVAQLLLKSGADANIKRNDGSTALRLAAREGHEAVVQLLAPLTSDS